MVRLSWNQLVGVCCGASLALAPLPAAADSRLIAAIRSRDNLAINALIKQRTEINTAEGDGTTPLHWAVHYDDLATTNLLIRAGAVVNAADDTGVTPLYLA